MNDSKPLFKLEHYSGPLIERLMTERAPIYTYNYSKAIRAPKPYICFIYIDTDSLPTITNVPLKRPDLYILLIDDAAQQPELHVLYRGDSRQSYDGKKANIQALTLDAQVSSVVVTIPLGEQHVFLNITLKPKDQREIPVVQLLKIDAQASAVEKTISCTTLLPSPAVTFNLIDQREKLTLQSLKQDVRAISIESTISIVEQKASLYAVLDHDIKHEEISTVPYILENRTAQYTNMATREEQQYDSYNHSLAVDEPRCFDYPVSKTRTRSRIIRYHRYFRTSHILPATQT